MRREANASAVLDEDVSICEIFQRRLDRIGAHAELHTNDSPREDWDAHEKPRSSSLSSPRAIVFA
jgi:hypothetical protein